MIRTNTWLMAPLLLALLACKGGSRSDVSAEGTGSRATAAQAAKGSDDEGAQVNAEPAKAGGATSAKGKAGMVTLTIVEGRSGVDKDTGFLHIMGMIKNDTSGHIGAPRVAIDLFDADGKPIGVSSIAAADGHGESALGMRTNVPPGEMSPFHYIRDIKKLARPYASHKLEAKAWPSAGKFNPVAIDVKIDKEMVGKTEYWRVTGNVKNDGKNCINPAAVVAFFDASGKLQDTSDGLTVWDVKNEWPSGNSLPFKTGPKDTGGVIVDAKVWGECEPPY